MAHRFKRNKADKLHAEAKQRQRHEQVIASTAARFTCATDTARDFSWQCEDELEDIEADLAFNRVAHEMWRDRPGRAEVLAQTLADFIAAREQHQQALTDLRRRFDALVAENIHEHLDPPEAYRDLIRRRVFAE